MITCDKCGQTFTGAAMLGEAAKHWREHNPQPPTMRTWDFTRTEIDLSIQRAKRYMYYRNTCRMENRAAFDKARSEITA